MTDEEPRIDDDAEKSFVEDAITRGDAVEPDEDGRLPPGATHEIVPGEEGDPPEIVRRRFSIS
jgi:hypothetical protein